MPQVLQVVNLRVPSGERAGVGTALLSLVPRLKCVNLSGTAVTADGIQLLVEKLQNPEYGCPSRLEVVNLAGPVHFAGSDVQGFGDAGACALASFVGDPIRSPRLSRLNMALNDIGPAGAAAICEALRGNKRLQQLCLADNMLFHTMGLEATLAGNTTLTHLDLTRCGIYETGIQACLCLELSSNRSLQSLGRKGKMATMWENSGHWLQEALRAQMSNVLFANIGCIAWLPRMH